MTATLGITTLIAATIATVAWKKASTARETVRQLHDYDPLTRLPTRSLLRNALDRALTDSRRTSSKVAVISVELSHFDYLNEAYGPDTGDALMVVVSRQLRDTVTTQELLFRYGGPQFVVVVPGCPDPTQARQRCEELLAAVARSYEVGRDRIRINAHAGVVLTDQQVIDADALILEAQVATRHADEQGRGSVSIYDVSMRNRFSPSVAEHRVREALDRGRFRLLYLPMVDLVHERFVGAEALLRWADRDSGLVSPGQFLRTLEETGLIVPVGTWVIEEAARQAATWNAEHPESAIDVTVNVSPRQLMQADFVDTIAAAIDSAGARPDRLCIEVSEVALIHDVEDAWTVLRQVKQLGVKLALDDFGTGQSSLAHLRRFQLDRLKIDRTFVAGMVDNREDASIVGHLVGLAKALGMEPIAKGVETEDQAQLLRQAKCRFAQGWLFSDARAPADFEELFSIPDLTHTELGMDVPDAPSRADGAPGGRPFLE